MSDPGGFDAVLLLAFGGPERMQDVRPFLDNVLRGRPVTAERYEQVVQHYEQIGGRSPLLELTRQQASALTRELAARGRPLPVHIGMRHWHPHIADTLAAIVESGARRVVAPILSAFDSPASRQAYETNVGEALRRLGADAPEVVFASALGATGGFVEANVAHIREASEQLGKGCGNPQLVFTAHSIPEAAASRSPYVEQYRVCAAAVAKGFGEQHPVIAYQSRSGTPQTPWLGPDILEVLRTHAQASTRPLVVAPIGFVCDHVEVLYDLDIEAARLADELGLQMVRAGAANAHPAFIGALADSIDGASTDRV